MKSSNTTGLLIKNAIKYLSHTMYPDTVKDLTLRPNVFRPSGSLKFMIHQLELLTISSYKICLYLRKNSHLQYGIIGLPKHLKKPFLSKLEIFLLMKNLFETVCTQIRQHKG